MLIDPSQETVFEIGEICKSVGTDFDVYIYTHIFNDLNWLETAFNVVDTVLIDTQPSGLSPVKDRLINHQKAYHYGPKKFLHNFKNISSAQEYFLLYIQTRLNSDFTE